MKKRMFRMACMMGVVALLTVSCKKNSDEKASVTLSMPQFTEDMTDEGRAYIDFGDGNQFKWNANDEIMVYNLDFSDGTNSVKAIYSTDAQAEGQLSTRFYGDNVEPKKDGFFYFYPASKASQALTLDVNNRETFTVDDTQKYTISGNNVISVDNDALALACQVNAISDDFTMQHIFGIFRLKLKGTKTVSSIVLRDNQFNLTGSVSMKLHKVNSTEFSQIMDKYALGDNSHVADLARYLQQLGYESNPTGKTITLDCSKFGNGGVPLFANQQSVFYIVVRPGALIKGFTVDVNFTDGTSETITKYENPKASYCIKPGYIKGFATSVNGVD